MTSWPVESWATTGRLTTAPVPRMATCGWLMIGVSNRAPRLPVLVTVKVPPLSSSGRELVRARALGEVGDASGQAGDVQVAGVADDGHEQPAIAVDGDAEVLGVEVGDGALGHVERGVHLRELLECLDRGLAEERQEGQLDALAGLEVALDPGRGGGDARDVDLDHAGQLRRHVQRLDHALGDDLAQPAHLDGAAAQVGRRRGSGGRGRCRRGGRSRCGRRGAAAAAAALAAAAAASTSDLRMRPPTPVPVDGRTGRCPAGRRGGARAG